MRHVVRAEIQIETTFLDHVDGRRQRVRVVPEKFQHLRLGLEIHLVGAIPQPRHVVGLPHVGDVKEHIVRDRVLLPDVMAVVCGDKFDAQLAAQARCALEDDGIAFCRVILNFQIQIFAEQVFELGSNLRSRGVIARAQIRRDHTACAGGEGDQSLMMTRLR